MLQPCAEPGCPNLVSRGRCREHQLKFDRARELRGGYKTKENAPWRWVYRDPRWFALRKRVRLEQPVCARVGCGERWTDLDHKVALQDQPDQDPFARDGVMGLCHKHHSAKTADEIRRRQ